MKLTIEKHPELTRLIKFFEEIEIKAQRMGIHIDDLNHDRKASTSTLHTYFRKNAKAITTYRAALLNGDKNSGAKSQEPCSISSLSIYKSE
ncbi:MAG: hypothetical protein KA444_07950 [Bacteroidia bacterium]|nr:hypothetical protein [Bacteroidia bacterium]